MYWEFRNILALTVGLRGHYLQSPKMAFESSQSQREDITVRSSQKMMMNTSLDKEPGELWHARRNDRCVVATPSRDGKRSGRTTPELGQLVKSL